nr:reverse transcriptase domain, reverse transcriptase zinc-binding domain protein [Tanacetum cinerariifolium]
MQVLLDLPLGGRSFTWMNKEGTKMSKLDWFLASSSVMDAFQDLKVTALPRGWPDGFTFLFIKSYWELLKSDIEAAVRDFFDHFVMPKGANSFFITLISKVANLIHIKDFHPISLIGLNIALKDAVGSGLVHGLNINISKSNMYGIGVSSEEIENIARATGCASSSLPFIYLGLPIGSNMNLIANWQFMIDRFRRKLSTWKANMLSTGGHFTLIKAGSSGDNKKMSWLKWDNILASNDKGGLGIGSLKAFNLALLQKWRWRLVTISDSLWARAVNAIHGVDTEMELKGCNSSGTWANIVDSFSMLLSKDIIPLHMLRHKRLGSRNEESLEILMTEISHVQVSDCQILGIGVVMMTVCSL